MGWTKRSGGLPMSSSTGFPVALPQEIIDFFEGEDGDDGGVDPQG